MTHVDSVEWHIARKVPKRTRQARAKNIFAGGTQIETAEIAGVSVTRLSAWPKGQKAAPVSFAVVEPEEEGMCAAAFEGFGEDDGVEIPKPAFPVPEVTWQESKSAKFPLNFDWQQSTKSRFEFFFDLPAEAKCFGLGERMSDFNLRGSTNTLFNTDNNLHIESADSLYKSIPLLFVYHHGQYHALFIDSPACQRWVLDMDLEDKARVELLSRRGWQLYWFGPASLPEILAAYTTLTGRSKLPPLWSLGHQQSRWSYPDEETVLAVAKEFRNREIPCDVVVLDIDYMDEYRVFTHSPDRFPNFEQMIQELEAENLKVVAIIDPGVKKDPKYFVFDDGKKHGFFCKKHDGKLFIDKVWAGPSAFPDFLMTETRLWWAALHGWHIDNGIAGIWNDMNEPAFFKTKEMIGPDTHDLPPEEDQLFMHTTEDAEPNNVVGHFEVRNAYGLSMSRASYEGLRALRPDDRPFVLSRSAYAGIQKYSAVWFGDNMSWWEHLAKSIPMLLNMGLSGVPFCGADIGGFGEHCSAELLIRWYAVGIFYPLFRNHCSMHGAAQEPWVFGPEAEMHCRALIEKRYRLLPYIQSLFYEHVRTGAPLVRPLFWHYPSDEFTFEIDDQFMFGKDILVAPILKRGQTTRSVYLPEGLWHPFEGGAALEGKKLHKVSFGLGEVPAFVRDGAILPLADVMQSTAEYPRIPITLMCYGSDCEGTLVEDDGWSMDYETGFYNEWKLSCKNGEFTSTPVYLGFDSLSRKFELECCGQRKAVELRPY